MPERLEKDTFVIPTLRIHILGKERGLTQTQLGELAKVNHNTNRRYWQNIGTLVDLAVLKRYSIALGVPISELILDDDEPTKEEN